MTVRVLWTRWDGPLSAEQETRCLRGMPDVLADRYRRLRRWQDRQATLFGKLLLLTALGGDVSAPPAWKLLDRLAWSDAGRPYLPEGPGFSISHSGSVAVLAVSAQDEVGIDVERIRPVPVSDFVRYLPLLAELEHLPEDERLVRFFHCWTRVEAVLKGAGYGLGAPLEEVRLEDGHALFRGRRWHLAEVACAAGYCCHLAATVPLASCTPEEVRYIL